MTRREAAPGLACLGSVFRVGGPLLGFIALPLANEPIQITKDPPYCSIKNDRRVRTVRTSATIRVNSASSAPVGVRMVAVACSVRQAYFRKCSLAGGPGEKPKTPP